MHRIALALLFSGIVVFCHAQTVKPEITMVRRQGTSLFFLYGLKKTDTRDYLAKRYNVPADSINKYNPGLKWEGLKEKTIIKIPVLASNFSTTKKSTAADTMIALYHTVEPKENLWSIGQLHGKAPVENIKIWNNLPDDKIAIGSNLIVGYLRRKRVSSGAVTTTTTPKETTVIKTIPDNKKPSNPSPAKNPAVTKAKPDSAVAVPVAIDTLVKKEEKLIVSPVPPTDSMIIKKKPDSVITATVVEQPYVKKAPLAKNRVNFIMKLSYLNSSFTGSDAVSSTYLLKNGSNFELRDVGGKKQINAFSGGLGIENKIGMRLSLQTEVLYERKGADVAIDSAQTITDKLNGDVRVRLNYLSFAFLPKLNFGKQTIFYVYAGIYGGFLMRSVIEGEATLKSNVGVSSISVNAVNSRRFNKADLGYASGLGIKFPYKKTKRQHFILEGRYTQSFGTISNEEINGRIPNILNRAFYVTAAYEFNR
jgi:LysM repeat protein